jgi:pimeloyl-ACP methyl ester carboxylesterase
MIAGGSTGREEIVRVGGLPLRIWRSGEGPPLMLINGLGAGIEMWTPLAERIRNREVIAFDLPGAGHSGHGRRPLGMKQLAGLVAAVLDRLDRDRVDLLGYSLGGLLAQEVAHRHPGRVERLVLAATSPGVPSVPPNPIAAALMLTPARYYNRRIAEMIVPIIAGGRTARDSGVLRRGVDLRLSDPPSISGYLHQLYAVCGWSSHRWLRSLPQSTLVLHGDQDPLVPLINARYLARTIRGAELHVVPGAGHLFLLDQPDDAIAAIESFLTKVSRPEGGNHDDPS